MNYPLKGDVLEQLEKAFYSINDKVIGWGEALIKSLPNILIAFLVLLVFWIVSCWVHRIVVRLFEKTDFNESLEQLIANVVKGCVLALGVVFALSILHLEKTVFSMLAGVGVLGLALGFAFQDLAANFVSGIMIAVRAPMRVGNVIEIDDVLGTVQGIRIRDTLVRNFSGQDVIIPNKDFMTHKFTNYSSFGSRKLTFEIGVGYDSDLGKAKQVVLEAMNGLEGILSEPAPSVFVESLGGSSVNLVAYAWIQYPGGDFLGVRDQGYIKAKAALDEAGIDIPFPIRTLELSKTSQEVFRPR